MNRHRMGLAVALVLSLTAGALMADTMVRDARGNVIYQYSNGIMYQGLASQNKRIFRYDEGKGEIWDLNGRKLAFWKALESALYPGSGSRPMYVYADKGAHPGSKGATALYFIDGRKIYHGNGPGGKLILYPDEPLPTPVAIFMAHLVTGGKPAPRSGLKVDWASVPYGYYLGPKGQGKIVLSLRGNKIYFNDQAKGEAAYTMKNLKIYRGDDTNAAPVFCLAKNGALFRGPAEEPKNLLMYLNWFNCYAAGKSGTDAIGTLQYVGENILTEGFTQPSQRPDFKGKAILLSSTLPNNRVDLALRIFLVYLTQLDPDFKAYAAGQK